MGLDLSEKGSHVFLTERPVLFPGPQTELQISISLTAGIQYATLNACCIAPGDMQVVQPSAQCRFSFYSAVYLLPAQRTKTAIVRKV